ncbi:FAD dependent oxidoreductase-domain-containing protein [Cadophora sp. MPI-SDFR-AT-0126]|nr:FAD dependent oxidoreductase-domain-containing protein [Leotiomycetes sp. MPI-SDFR-AT-0126]
MEIKGKSKHVLGDSVLADVDTKPGLNGNPVAIGFGFGFPKPGGGSISHWLQGAIEDPLFNHRSTTELPLSVDIIIIGSGISGTLIAKHSLETWPEKSVLVIEARRFCSGATGRNAGHCKPDQYRGFSKYEQAFGTEQAIKILENEQQTWSDVVSYVKENNVHCDFWVGDTLDVPTTSATAHATKAAYECLKAAGGKTDHIKVTLDPVEASKISRIKDAQACYAWPASTLNPWKLTAHIMRSNLQSNKFNLQTHTLVTGVSRSTEDPEKWTVHTSDRGSISCSEVVHATNAYSSAIEPSMRGIIRPHPHICTRAIPPSTFTGSVGLQNSYGVLLDGGAMFSVNPRCTADGVVLFGGSNPGQKRLNEWLEKHPERWVDDDLSGEEFVTPAVKNFAEKEYIGWNTTHGNEAAVYDHSWSGIIALTPDSVPLIGELPGLPGQWICAGHNGHGMARIFTAAPGLVKLMNGKTWEDTNLPDVFAITPERMSRLRECSQL